MLEELGTATVEMNLLGTCIGKVFHTGRVEVAPGLQHTDILLQRIDIMQQIQLLGLQIFDMLQ